MQKQIRSISWQNALRSILLLLMLLVGISMRKYVIGPTDCDNIIAFDENKKPSGVEWGCGSLPGDLRDVLEPHCIVQGEELPLSTLLPDLDFFRRVVRLFDSHARAEVWQLRGQLLQQQEKEGGINENATSTASLTQKFLKEKSAQLIDYMLVAGRGTTGTSAVSNWLGGSDNDSSLNIGSLHYSTAQCPTITSSKSRCYEPIQREGTHKIHAALLQIRNKTSSKVTEDEYKQLFDALSHFMEVPRQKCGECVSASDSLPTCNNGFGGRVALLDSPWVLMFTELYFALGPDTKVVLTRRDDADWTRSRIGGHGCTSTVVVCGDKKATNYNSQALHDPFSYTQCVSTARSVAVTEAASGVELDDMNNNVSAGQYTHIRDICSVDLSYLKEAFGKYNMFVEGLVPQNYRLDINLFTSKILFNEATNNKNGTTARERWTSLNRQLIEEFFAC